MMCVHVWGEHGDITVQTYHDTQKKQKNKNKVIMQRLRRVEFPTDPQTYSDRMGEGGWGWGM